MTIEEIRDAKKQLTDKMLVAIKEFKDQTGFYPAGIEYKPAYENTKSGAIFLGHDLSIKAITI